MNFFYCFFIYLGTFRWYFSVQPRSNFCGSYLFFKRTTRYLISFFVFKYLWLRLSNLIFWLFDGWGCYHGNSSVQKENIRMEYFTVRWVEFLIFWTFEQTLILPWLTRFFFTNIFTDSKLKFNFAILCAGFKSKSSEHSKYYTNNITCPTLHVYGDTDQVIPKGKLFEIILLWKPLLANKYYTV